MAPPPDGAGGGPERIEILAGHQFSIPCPAVSQAFRSPSLPFRRVSDVATDILTDLHRRMAAGRAGAP